VEKHGGSIKEEELENSKDIFFLKNMKKIIEEVNENTGEVEQKEEAYKILRSYKVWNTEQVDGINFQHEEPKSDNEKVQEIEEFLKSINPIVLRGEPAYSKQGDCIYIPHISDFEDTENYYSTFFHELSHWTNSKSRIDRDEFLKKYADKAYGIEELIAEMSSAFLCAEKGISMENTQHSEYLASWVKNIKENPYILFSASSQASKATTYLEKLSLNNIQQKQEHKQGKTKSKNKFATPKAS
jgi:antirestriction protein ArdC